MAAVETLPGFDLLPRVSCTVAGIDPSSKRIAVAFLSPSGLSWTTVSLSQQPGRAARFADAYDAQRAFFARLARPAAVFLEEPFLPRDRREAPTHLLMYGVTLAAIGSAWGSVPLVELGTNVWKCAALGKGHGFAKKPEVLSWATRCGYDGAIEDEADAIGIAAGGALLNPSLLAS